MLPCVACAQASSEALGRPITLSGELGNEGGKGLVQGRITINGVELALDSNGAYNVGSEELPVYAIRYQADRHYPMIHTFSHDEVLEAVGRLPAVTLIENSPVASCLPLWGMQ